MNSAPRISPRKQGVRILSLVTDAFGGYGGIALFNRYFLETLAAYPGCGAVVTLPRLMSSDPGELPPRIIHVTDAIGGKWRYLAVMLRTLHENGDFELITCGHINLLPVAYVAHLLTGAPVVLTMHGIDVWQPPRNLLCRWLTGKLFAYVAVSKLTATRFRSWARNSHAKEYVLPNAVRLEAFAPGEKDPALAAHYGVAGKRVLMTLGRLVDAERYKGFDEVIEVLPDLLKGEPDLVYMIAGKGFDMDRLKRKAEALGVREQVVFTGYVPEEGKAALYRLADVYVMASRGEGFGFVIIEALATGIPTIASCADGGREAVRDGLLGQVIDPGDREELKNAIRKGLAMPKGVPAGLEYFSYANFQSRLHAMLEQWLAHSAAASES